MTTAIKGWRERAGLPASYEITCPSPVERALLEEVAELRKGAVAIADVVAICIAERNEFQELAALNNGRDSDFAFGSVNSAERILAAVKKLSEARA